MIALDRVGRKLWTGLAALMVLALTGCGIGLGPIAGGEAAGPARTEPVRIGLLVPGAAAGASPAEQAQNAAISRDLTNAANLAATERGGVVLTVHETGGTAEGTRTAVAAAVAQGAEVLVGPLFADAAAAAGVAAAPGGLNVLSFSNTTSVAGGNVFVLGDSFEGRAARLLGYAASQGRDDVFAVYGDTVAERIAFNAIVGAAPGSGARLAGQQPYPFSADGIAQAVAGIAAGVRGSQADALLFTATPTGALPLLLQLLPDAGIAQPERQFISLARLDVGADTLALPGIEGTWFPIPDPTSNNGFRARYRAAYGADPHPLAGLAYDGVSIVSGGGPGRGALTASGGYPGAYGTVRLLPSGIAQRLLAVAQVQGGQSVLIDPAPTRFGGAGL